MIIANHTVANSSLNGSMGIGKMHGIAVGWCFPIWLTSTRQTTETTVLYLIPYPLPSYPMMCKAWFDESPVFYSAPLKYTPCTRAPAKALLDDGLAFSVQTVRAQGIGGLYKGFGPAVVRGFPANGTCFAVYELTATLLRKMNDPAE